MNKATLKDYFPLPFTDQVLDTLSGKQYFSFLDGYRGYNQILITPKDQGTMTFTCPWGTYAYRVLPFGLCNAPTTFQRVVLGIFTDLVHDCVEVYMDDFTVYGNTFKEALVRESPAAIGKLPILEESCHFEKRAQFLVRQ